MSSQILAYNYLAEATVAEVDASSETAGFPVENVYNYTRRSKVWRSSGHFEVKTGLNKIIFQESIGVDLTAEVVVGHYETFALFAAAVKAALELVGANTYTITQDSTTKKIKIASNGATLRLIWTDSDSATMAGILGFSTAADDIGATTYTADILKTSSEEYILIDFGMAVNPDAVVISWRTDEQTKISGLATVTLKASFTNSLDSAPYSQTLTKTDYGYFIKKSSESDDGISDTPYRFWKISITDSTNPYGYIDIGSVFIGKWMNFTRGRIQFPFTMGYETGSTKSVTDGGQILAQNKYSTRRFSVDWFGLTQSEKQMIDEFSREVSTTSPFYLMLDSGTVVSDSTEKSLVYCSFEDMPSWTMDFPGVFSCDMSLREEI